MSYLEQGCPIIASVEEGSELARGIRESGCGISVPPGDALSLARLLVKLSDNSDWKSRMRENAERVFESNFSEVKILQRWSSIVTE
jgi:colanic acid biosynthesis glycosyl transferase WcaI